MLPDLSRSDRDPFDKPDFFNNHYNLFLVAPIGQITHRIAIDHTNHYKYAELVQFIDKSRIPEISSDVVLQRYQERPLDFPVEQSRNG